MNLYVSNLTYTLTDEELLNEFAAYGTVTHARVVKDREDLFVFFRAQLRRVHLIHLWIIRRRPLSVTSQALS